MVYGEVLDGRRVKVGTAYTVDYKIPPVIGAVKEWDGRLGKPLLPDLFDLY